MFIQSKFNNILSNDVFEKLKIERKRKTITKHSSNSPVVHENSEFHNASKELVFWVRKNANNDMVHSYMSSKWKPFWQNESPKKIWGKRRKIQHVNTKTEQNEMANGKRQTANTENKTFYNIRMKMWWHEMRIWWWKINWVNKCSNRDSKRVHHRKSRTEQRSTTSNNHRPQEKKKRNIKFSLHVFGGLENFYNVSDWIYKAIQALDSMCKQYDGRIFTRIELKCDSSLLQMNLIESHENDCWQWTLFRIQHPASSLFSIIICIICGILVWLITFRIILFL